jgi:Zn-dependent protease
VRHFAKTGIKEGPTSTLYGEQMIDGSIKIGRVLDIDVLVHPLLLVVVGLGILQWIDRPLYGLIFGLASLLFVLGHELGHCLVARARQLPAETIVLWPLGGLAFVGESDDPTDNALVALGGPAVNVAFCILFWIALVTLSAPTVELWSCRYHYGTNLLADLFHINLTLALVNLCIPVEPLDGGRIVRSLLLKDFDEEVTSKKMYRFAILSGVILWALAFCFQSTTCFVLACFTSFRAFQLLAAERKKNPTSGYVVSQPASGKDIIENWSFNEASERIFRESKGPDFRPPPTDSGKKSKRSGGKQKDPASRRRKS